MQTYSKETESGGKKLQMYPNEIYMNFHHSQIAQFPWQRVLDLVQIELPPNKRRIMLSCGAQFYCNLFHIAVLYAMNIPGALIVNYKEIDFYQNNTKDHPPLLDTLLSNLLNFIENNLHNKLAIINYK